jgi:signal transduction histidine kinase
MRTHDILGQRLTVLLHTIQNDRDLDYELLTSLSKGLLDELKAEQRETRPYDELKSIQQIFAAIGVNIHFEGQLPDNARQACLFVDIIREGSTNAVRHGFATQINIKSQPIQNAFTLTINNNGYIPNVPIRPGSGIGIMRKKVNTLGGNLDINHFPLFTLSVILPGGDPNE